MKHLKIACSFGLLGGLVPLFFGTVLVYATGIDYGWYSAIPGWMAAGFTIGFLVSLFEKK